MPAELTMSVGLPVHGRFVRRDHRRVPPAFRISCAAARAVCACLAARGKMCSQTGLNDPRLRRGEPVILRPEPAQGAEPACPFCDAGSWQTAETADTSCYIGRPKAVLIAGQDEVTDCADGVAILPTVGDNVVETENVGKQELEQQSFGSLGSLAGGNRPVGLG